MTALESGYYPLALNENPYGPLPSVRRALERALMSANRYPEFLPDRLPGLIANRLGCSPDQIVVGPGATSVILYILQATVTAGVNRVVMAEPTFDGYPLLTRTVGGEPVLVPLTATGSQNLDALATAIDERTATVVVCNPHNPTGTRLRTGQLFDFLDRIDRRVAVILDEAYIDFVPSAQRIDIDALLARYPNVIVVRTFSKAYGLAGLRIGFALMVPAVAARIARWQVPFGMNILAEVAVRACYRAEPQLEARIGVIARERDRLAAALRREGYSPPDSVANYVFVPIADSLQADRIAVALAHGRVSVKWYRTGIRITVGDRAANDAAIVALTDAYAGVPAPMQTRQPVLG